MDMSQQQDGTSATWHAPSLRGRLAMLAATVVILLSATLLILIWVLRTTQANAVLRSQKHLAAVARSLVDAYETRADKTVSLSNLEPTSAPPKPPPPGPPPHPPGRRPRSPQEQSLEQITASILVDATGIEGGFYRAADERLLGYAFPTHEGPGDPTALPARETPDIVNLATSAFVAKSPQRNQFYGPHDVVLFEAMPVCETKACEGGPVGAVWLMHRIPGAEEDRKRALLWSAFGFGTIACITVLFAFFVLRQVGRGTDAVVDRLAAMEVNLDDVPRPSGVRLAEFHRLLDGLDRLGISLQRQMDRERALQTRVRHNERLAAIGQLAAGVAHELRNPLATIRLRAQMTQRKTAEDSTAQGAKVILTEVDRLDAIIQRLLNFSRPIQISRTETNVAALCIAAVMRWSARSPQMKILYIGETNILATIDALRTDQVLDNLIENAVNQHEERHTDGARIQLGCFAQNGTLLLVVEDNAGGFTPEALQNAVEPFFTTRAKGTGLGLAITQEIVHASGGSLLISNHTDGASVRIEIPTGER